MKEHNVTNRNLAEILGISEKQIGKKIRGECDFKSKECFILSDYFERPIEEIFLPSMYENRTNKYQEEPEKKNRRKIIWKEK